MPWVDVRFPEQIAYGASGGPGFSTDIVQSVGGMEQRNANWSLARGRWEVGLRHRTTEETQAFIAFFYAVAQGQLNAFRFKDVLDSTFTNEVIGQGDGTTTAFSLVKTYTVATQSYQRVLTKPVAGTVTVTANNVPVVGFTVNTMTGVVTITPAPAAGVLIRASGEFDVPVRLSIDDLSGLTYVSVDAYSWESVQLLEVRIDAQGEG
jgi:uncharacterized protein (TIGR02217 family)